MPDRVPEISSDRVISPICSKKRFIVLRTVKESLSETRRHLVYPLKPPECFPVHVC